MELTFALLQQLSVYLVVVYLISKTPVFTPLTSLSGHLSHRITCYIIFSLFCILGTYLGLGVENAIANTRAIGAVIGGLLGGPLVGFAVGLTGGLHRYTMGGFTDVACTISTTAEGLLGGLVHLYYMRRHCVYRVFSPLVALAVLFVAEIMQMIIILLVATPFDDALHTVQIIALPMIIANSLGAALFMSILRDSKRSNEKTSVSFSNKALKIAERTVGILNSGFNQQSSRKIAQIIYEETDVGAVSITDREKILAFIGIGDDHHLPDHPISSTHTKQVIQSAEILFADGYEVAYQCSIKNTCKLGAALIIPLLDGNNRVLGTIKLYEPKQKLFSSLNRSLGEGLAKLLSNQILNSRYNEQQTLLTQAELRLLQAQVNPHFLFNALNTISAVIRREPDKARSLILHLSQFFRQNLKLNIESVTIKDELNHISAYLEIELARFSDRLQVNLDIEEQLLPIIIPTFTLQPLVENAIKHGTSTLLNNGIVEVIGRVENNLVILSVVDNAGTYCSNDTHLEMGLGLQIVDKRIKNRFGNEFGLKMLCQPSEYTTAKITFPFKKES